VVSGYAVGEECGSVLVGDYEEEMCGTFEKTAFRSWKRCLCRAQQRNAVPWLYVAFLAIGVFTSRLHRWRADLNV
jgi:hypothetical protein